MQEDEQNYAMASKRRKIDYSNLKRPSCLNLITREKMNRSDIVQKLKQLKFP